MGQISGRPEAGGKKIKSIIFRNKSYINKGIFKRRNVAGVVLQIAVHIT